MSRTYALDETAAKEANTGGKRVTEPGVYVGKFRAAWAEANDKGTESVNLIFETESGQEVGPLALYTHRGDGTELPSYKTLNAIIACLKIKGIRPTPGSVTLWDFDTKAEVVKQKETYPSMVGPRIGLVLTSEDYQNRDGDVKARLVIAAPFVADTRQMANEVLGGMKAESLDKYIGWLDSQKRWHKPLKGSRPAPSGAVVDDQFIDDDLLF